VEQFLHTHPKIADVYIFGVPDDRMGEEVCAWIKVTSGEELSDPDVRAFCKGQISHFKIPRHIRFVDEFPLTVTGKVQKFKMAEAMVEELKGGENV
jgi:fatty-acyl-CoA synthase